MEFLISDVRPSSLLGYSTVSGEVDGRSFKASVIESDHIMNEGLFNTKIDALEVVGLCDYDSAEGWIQEPSENQLDYVKQIVYKIATNIRTVSIRR